MGSAWRLLFSLFSIQILAASVVARNIVSVRHDEEGNNLAFGKGGGFGGEGGGFGGFIGSGVGSGLGGGIGKSGGVHGGGAGGGFGKGRRILKGGGGGGRGVGRAGGGDRGGKHGGFHGGVHGGAGGGKHGGAWGRAHSDADGGFGKDICICLESDAQGMISTVLSRGVDLSPLGCLIEDCQELLHAAGRVSIVHGFREVNGVADRLAHYALSSHVFDVAVEWWDSPPVWLSDTLLYDSS